MAAEVFLICLRSCAAAYSLPGLVSSVTAAAYGVAVGVGSGGGGGFLGCTTMGGAQRGVGAIDGDPCLAAVGHGAGGAGGFGGTATTVCRSAQT